MRTPLVLGDEASRRDSQAVTLRVQRAKLDPAMQLEAWDSTAKVTFDQQLLNELVSLRFLACESAQRQESTNNQSPGMFYDKERIQRRRNSHLRID